MEKYETGCFKNVSLFFTLKSMTYEVLVAKSRENRHLSATIDPIYLHF